MQTQIARRAGGAGTDWEQNSLRCCCTAKAGCHIAGGGGVLGGEPGWTGSSLPRARLVMSTSADPTEGKFWVFSQKARGEPLLGGPNPEGHGHGAASLAALLWRGAACIEQSGLIFHQGPVSGLTPGSVCSTVLLLLPHSSYQRCFFLHFSCQLACSTPHDRDKWLDKRQELSYR